MADLSGGDDWGRSHSGSSFRRLLEHLVGETVEIQTDDSAFSGKLADVETTFVTLASTSENTSVILVYIPVRKINAVTNL